MFGRWLFAGLLGTSLSADPDQFQANVSAFEKLEEEGIVFEGILEQKSKLSRDAPEFHPAQVPIETRPVIEGLSHTLYSSTLALVPGLNDLHEICNMVSVYGSEHPETTSTSAAIQQEIALLMSSYYRLHALSFDLNREANTIPSLTQMAVMPPPDVIREMPFSPFAQHFETVIPNHPAESFLHLGDVPLTALEQLREQVVTMNARESGVEPENESEPIETARSEVELKKEEGVQEQSVSSPAKKPPTRVKPTKPIILFRGGANRSKSEFPDPEPPAPASTTDTQKQSYRSALMKSEKL
jgi:hypothetical protein